MGRTGRERQTFFQPLFTCGSSSSSSDTIFCVAWRYRRNSCLEQTLLANTLPSTQSQKHNIRPDRQLPKQGLINEKTTERKHNKRMCACTCINVYGCMSVYVREYTNLCVCANTYICASVCVCLCVHALHKGFYCTCGNVMRDGFIHVPALTLESQSDNRLENVSRRILQQTHETVASESEKKPMDQLKKAARNETHNIHCLKAWKVAKVDRGHHLHITTRRDWQVPKNGLHHTHWN